jgi:hypothetical protein
VSPRCRDCLLGSIGWILLAGLGFAVAIVLTIALPVVGLASLVDALLALAS